MLQQRCPDYQYRPDRAVHSLQGQDAALRPVQLPQSRCRLAQLLGDGMPFVGIGAKEPGAGNAAQNRGELPAEVEGVLHGDIHALAGLGATGVAGIAGDENAGDGVCARFALNVVETVAEALADLVDRPPANISIVRQAIPSAWPSRRGPDFCSTMRVATSGKAASCAASVRPAGPQPTMRTSTGAGGPFSATQLLVNSGPRIRPLNCSPLSSQKLT